MDGALRLSYLTGKFSVHAFLFIQRLNLFYGSYWFVGDRYDQFDIIRDY